MSEIVLCTFNARYQHTAFGLRCLRANLGELKDRSSLLEVDLQAKPVDVVERLRRLSPRIVGVSVYVWNAPLVAELVELLATLSPDVFIVLGGPEVSHELEHQPWTQFADAIIQGEGELQFAALCREVLAGAKPSQRVFPSKPPPIDTLALPYAEYTDDDLAHRVIYVEASRGCPYSCEFCLSALDEKVRAFPLEPFLASMQSLIDRGARQFKFVDRTFNLKIDVARRILEFFLQQPSLPELFLHFEMVPDRFPVELRELVLRFPKGALQFEVGVQTFDVETSKRISRRQDVAKLENNLGFLRDAGVHVHADLIAGLPGESIGSFAAGFDRLVRLGPSEIQLGILKRLRGAPIARHTGMFGMRYATRPPYEVLETNALSFDELQHLKRFARLWDSIANSGNFVATLPLILDAAPFERFGRLVHFIAEKERSAGVSLLRLVELVHAWLVADGIDDARVRDVLLSDYRRGGRHETPKFLKTAAAPVDTSRRDARQRRHRAPA